MGGIDDDSDEDEDGEEGGGNSAQRGRREAKADEQDDDDSNEFVHVTGPDGSERESAGVLSAEHRTPRVLDSSLSPPCRVSSPEPVSVEEEQSKQEVDRGTQKEEVHEVSQEQVHEEPESIVIEAAEEDNNETGPKMPGSFDLEGPHLRTTQVQEQNATWGELFRRLSVK